jgi:glyoxylase-like metal-dependent hydrolase (beta-lactamase superfamily II)
MPGTVEEIMLGAGFKPEQVTDVIFTHLHFDHGSGAFKRVPGKIVKAFPKARYHVLKEHFRYASRPKRKERNSFFTTFFKSLERIWWLEDWKESWMDITIFSGHTENMVVPGIKAPGKDIWFLADLIPMEIFLEPDVSSGFDLDKDLVFTEKGGFLAGLKRPVELVLFHDPYKPKINLY